MFSCPAPPARRTGPSLSWLSSSFLARFPAIPLVSLYLSGQHLHSLQYWAPTKKPHKVTFDLGTFYDMYVIDPNSDFSLGHQHSTLSDDVQLPSTEYCAWISKISFGGISILVLTTVPISVYCLASRITETISPPRLRNVGPSPRPYGIFYEPHLHGQIRPPEPFQFFEC